MNHFWITVALTIAPGVFIALFFYWRDRYEPEPLPLMIKAFAVGMLATLLASYLEQWIAAMYTPPLSTAMAAVDAFLVIALIEEGMKFYLLMSYIFYDQEFNEPYDGLLYSVLVSMGFATFENIFYVMQWGMGVAVLRMFTAVPAHAVFGALMGYFVGLAKFRRRRKRFLWAGLLIAVLFHGSYDFFLMQQIAPEWESGAYLVIVVGLISIYFLIRRLNRLSPFRPPD